MGKIFVNRKKYNKDGADYYSYFIKGKKFGRDFDISMVPSDFGGYVVLDMIFSGKESVELIVKPFEFKTDKGETLKGNTYSVKAVCADGTELECPLKARRGSDKSLLKMLTADNVK